MIPFKFFQRENVKCAIVSGSIQTFAEFRQNHYDFHRTLIPNHWNGNSFSIEGKDYHLILSPDDLRGRRFNSYIQLRDAFRSINHREILFVLNDLMGANEML